MATIFSLERSTVEQEDPAKSSGLPETVAEMARRMTTAKRNFVTVWRTTHNTFHHRQHTIRSCPQPSCVKMREALAMWPDVESLVREAAAESAEARAEKLEGKRSRL